MSRDKKGKRPDTGGQQVAPRGNAGRKVQRRQWQAEQLAVRRAAVLREKRRRDLAALRSQQLAAARLLEQAQQGE